MSAESIAVDALTLRTTELLDVSVALRSDTAARITAAVATSVNAAQIPLAAMARNLIDTQTLLVTYIARG
jgi:hypothetical protein